MLRGAVLLVFSLFWPCEFHFGAKVDYSSALAASTISLPCHPYTHSTTDSSLKNRYFWL